ncbi:MAG: bacteriohemerythrin, partial [Hylemonella sp.]
MALMPWSSELELGIAKIDEQHRWLVDRINALHDELGQAAPNRQTLGDILESLVDYTMNHFIVEEEIFKRHGYPQTDAHLGEHNGFTGKIIVLLDQFHEGAEVGGETMALLKEWLTHHILVVD